MPEPTPAQAKRIHKLEMLSKEQAKLSGDLRHIRGEGYSPSPHDLVASFSTARYVLNDKGEIALILPKTTI